MIKNLKSLTIIAISSLIILTVAYTDVSAQEESVEYKLYVLETCEYCNTLKQELEDQGLLSELTVIEISEEPNRTEFLEVVEKCSIKSAVPVIYDGNKCYQGQTSALAVFGVDQNENQEDETIKEPQEDTIDTITDTQSQSLDETSNPTTDDFTKQETDTTQSSPSTLSDRIFGTQTKAPPPDIPTINIIVMFIAPIALLSLGYYIITKMKV